MTEPERRWRSGLFYFGVIGPGLAAQLGARTRPRGQGASFSASGPLASAAASSTEAKAFISRSSASVR